ncbi:secretion/DNA translocation related TadE-like protein [Marmoricola sp. OAE513]|uniref:Rv3654c family TadE-like protein n=1 Tax=Marmoricola sp. OAE513 TaxID=2817894 RepID=UPI001AE57B31
MNRRRSQDGVATTLALVVVGVLVFVAALACGATAVVVGHRRAQAAADLGALAAAEVLQSGGDGCAAAGSIVVANAAELVGCSSDNGSTLVSVVIRLPRLLGQRELHARARAGPSGSR